MKVSTSKYRLTPRQRHVAAQLSRHFLQANTPQGFWHPNSPSTLRIDVWPLRIEGGATREDFEALAANKLVRCQTTEQNGLTITVLKQLRSAVDEGFGIPTRLRILQALIEMCVERGMQYARLPNIDELLGPTQDHQYREIEALCAGELLEERRIELREMSHEPFYRITKAGVAEAKAEAESLEAESMEQEHSSGNHIFNNSVVGAVVTGGMANVQQTINPKLSEVLELLEKSKLLLSGIEPDKRTEAIEALDDLKTELQSPNPKPSRIKAFAKTALGVSIGVVGFAANIATILQVAGVTPEDIKRLTGL